MKRITKDDWPKIEREELLCTPNPNFKGWLIHETVGVGVTNIWSLVPKNKRWVQKLNTWICFLGIILEPNFSDDAVFCGWNTKFVNPIKNFVDVFKKSKVELL